MILSHKSLGQSSPVATDWVFLSVTGFISQRAKREREKETESLNTGAPFIKSEHHNNIQAYCLLNDAPRNMTHFLNPGLISLLFPVKEGNFHLSSLLLPRHLN